MSAITITPDLIAKNDLTQTDPSHKVTQDLSNYNGAQMQHLISSNDHGQIDKGKIDHNMYTQGQTAANANDVNYAEVSVKANSLMHLSYHVTEPAGSVQLTVEKLVNGIWIVVSMSAAYTSIQYPVSSIQYPVSSIQYPVSSIQYPSLSNPGHIAIYNTDNTVTTYRLVMNVLPDTSSTSIASYAAPQMQIYSPTTLFKTVLFSPFKAMMAMAIEPETSAVTETLSTAISETTSALKAPKASSNPDGTHVYGQSEPGTTIEIKNAKGNVIGGGPVNPDGSFDIEVSPELTNGEKGTVIAKDSTGNPYSTTPVIGHKDTLIPESPIAILNDDGNVVSGSSEPNALVIIRDVIGKELSRGYADSKGTFSFTVSPAQKNG